MARFASRIRLSRFSIALAFLGTPLTLQACGSGTEPPPDGRVPGQHGFVSSPPAGAVRTLGESGGADAGAVAPGKNDGTSGGSTRQVEETDLYRLDGDRLFYLNGYRGLMVFDVSDVDHPKLLGRSPIYGSPVEMIVRNGVATVVVADWYGTMEDGTPFHGSIVRGLDATDPAHIQVLGEAKLGGWVRDTRVVGDVLYAVSEDYGWEYGWDEGPIGGGVVGIGGGGATGPNIIVSSVSFANGNIQSVARKEYDGWNGIFNVTPNAILFAHDAHPNDYQAPGQTELRYLDISDPAGAIVERGAITVDGRAQGWGADNGRWNLDFADGKTAHVVGCATSEYWGCGGNGGSYVLATADFSNPDAPALASSLSIPATGWSVAARFDNGRLYLSPDSGYYYGSGGSTTTPLEIFDLSDPKAPKMAGSVQIPGNVWNLIPDGSHLFALGSEYTPNPNNPYGDGEQISLKYLDVANAAAPQLLGDAAFGQGWAWTPAAGTFKAFTKDDSQGLVVLPFSGWDYKGESYQDGVQLLSFDAKSIHAAGAASTRGWVERGIFVKGRIVSLSDLSLSVVDYSDLQQPRVVSETTLARNVVAAHPNGQTITEISSDWWGNDVSKSEVRVLPISNAEESTDVAGAPTIAVDGVNARVFTNGALQYVVTDVRVQVDCADQGGGGPAPAPDPKGGGTPTCYAWTEQVQIVDASDGGAKLRGKVALPNLDPGGGGWYGWGGYYWYDWYDGAGAVQVGNDALAFRRVEMQYDPNRGPTYHSTLYVVDLSNADAPSVASATVTPEPEDWWGNMVVVGQTLYTTHYEWLAKPGDPSDPGTVKYYADRIDLSDRAHPKVQAKINTPGILVGGSQLDPNLLYTIDYRWDSGMDRNDFDVVSVEGDQATLVSTLRVDGWVGQVFVRGSKAYMSAQHYDDWRGDGSRVELHQIDVSDGAHPIDRASAPAKGWGWLIGVEGDRAIVTSGWSGQGIDVYRLKDDAAPEFSQFVRTSGWWTSSLARQASTLFLSSGYWGVQAVTLQ